MQCILLLLDAVLGDKLVVPFRLLPEVVEGDHLADGSAANLLLLYREEVLSVGPQAGLEGTALLLRPGLRLRVFRKIRKLKNTLKNVLLTSIIFLTGEAASTAAGLCS